MTTTAPEVRLTILLPTIGRPSLAATLASIRAAGAGAGDELLVIDDGAESPVFVESALTLSLLPTRCLVKILTPERRLGTWGHAASNLAMREASGTHVVRIDDDDAYEPGALDTIRAMIALAPERVHIWRMASRGGVIWTDESIRQGNVGTPMFGVPLGCAGRWGARYEGDHDYVCESVANSGQPPIWHPATLVRCG